jgi:hypothetical protein
VNPLKMFGLAALAALMAMAFASASSAMAESTKLCTGDPTGSGCGSAVTHVHETTLAGAKAKLLFSIETVECDVLFLGDTQNGPLAGSWLLIEGNFTYSNCGSCTVEEVGVGSFLELLKEGHETATVVEGLAEIHVSCPGLNAFYIGSGLLTAKGPLLSSETNGQISGAKRELSKTKGLFGSPSGELDITTTPLSATYIGS